MSDEDEAADDDEAGEAPENRREHLNQEFQYQPVSARVPERVGRGVFSTGAVVLQGPDEFLIDFILKLAHPHQVVARIILPAPVIPRFIAALQENLRIYEQVFGGLPRIPTPQQPVPEEPPPASIQELYDQLKLADDLVGGCYANAVMITHAPTDFCFDFIANLFPKSVVNARVFLSAPQVPPLLDVLIRTWKKYEETRGREPPEFGGEESVGDE